jgi:glyceraldehyde 3-phosphate dehydrogenase
MTKKIAINGFGRIGRSCLRIILDNFKDDLDVVLINDLGDIKTLAHIFEYDSLYGKYNKDVQVKDNHILIDGKEIKTFEEKDPLNLPLKELGVDLVLECTGSLMWKRYIKKLFKATLLFQASFSKNYWSRSRSAQSSCYHCHCFFNC